MDYQEPPHSNTIHLRYSSDFRQAHIKYFLASKSAPTEKSSVVTTKRDPAQYPSLGGIVLKKMPSGWQAAQPDFSVHGSAKMFVAQQDERCAIVMVYDALRPKYRKSMQRLMESAAGPVKDEELQNLKGLIPDYNNNKKESELISAYTKTIDGKRVLAIEEKSVALNRYYYFVYSSDSKVGFQTYTKIWFVAPINVLPRYKNEAVDAINSLKFL